MTLTAEEFGYAPSAPYSGQPGPLIETNVWGYAIRDGRCAFGTRAVIAAVGRFIGAILLMASVGLWILPDSIYGAELFAMKLGAMVMFTVLGGYLVWAGSTPGHLEYHVDTHRRELRIGRRDIRGGFRQKCQLSFDDVASVYMLRSKEHRSSTRLYLRLAGSDGALEIAAGPEPALDNLRDRLTRDLTRPARRSADLTKLRRVRPVG